MPEALTISDNVRDILLKHAHRTTPEESLNEILRNEIERDIKKHLLTIKHFERKYGMDFKAFEETKVNKDIPYEVEKEYFEWDMAVTLIEDLKEELKQLNL